MTQVFEFAAFTVHEGHQQALADERPAMITALRKAFPGVLADWFTHVSESRGIEHLSVIWPAGQGGNPALYGGFRKGHDVADGEQLIDAKLLVPASASETKREGCTRKLRRDPWKASDPDLTTHVMLVGFPPDWTGQSDTSFSQTTITIQHENVRLYLVEVDEINDILASRRAEAEAARWAFIFLDDDWLKEHLVHPLPADQEEDQP